MKSLPTDGSLVIGNRYRIFERLGEGGTGSVYRALDCIHQEEVALKFLHPASGGEGPPASIIDSEFRVLAELRHPNLVEVHDYGITPEGLRFFTMESFRGLDLKTYVERLSVRREARTLGGQASTGVLDAGSGATDVSRRGEDLGRDPVFRDLVGQVLAALDFIHTRKVVHEDLKPANILVEDRAASGPAGSPKLKLIDFGLARLAGEGSHPRSGTVEYMAPEKLRGSAGDPRSDLYSLGILLFEIFTGDPPFRGSSPLEVARGHLEGEVPPRLLAAIPEPFRGAIARLLARSPSDRIPSASEVLRLLFGDGAAAPRLLPAFGSAFVGRSDVLGRLLERFGRMKGGGGAAVLLKGEPGIGKSRLLRELRLRLQLQGARVIAAETRKDVRRPGDILALVLRALALESGLDASLRMHPALRAVIGEAPGREPADLPASLGHEGDRERLVHGAAELLAGLAATSPTALLVDDVQWADSVDLGFLVHLVRRIGTGEVFPVLLCMAGREDSDEERRAVAEVEGAGARTRSIETAGLAGLEEEDVREYLGQALGGARAFPQDLPAALLRDTGGNPFFLEEFLKLAAESGGIVRDGSAWRVLPGRLLETPRSVGDTIRRRLEPLEGPDRRVLEWAAVLEEPFTAEEIATLSEGAALSERQAGGTGTEALPGAVERSLERLALGGLLARSGPRFSLAHGRVGAVLYESIPEPLRRARHRRIGESILARGDLDLGRRRESLAHHLFLSDRPELAREHLLRAGARAFRSGALREAARWLGRGLEVTSGARERFGILLEREAVWGLLGERDLELEDLRALSTLAPSLGDPSLEAEAAVREAAYLDAMGRKREAVSRYDAALALAEGAGDRRAAARILGRRAMARAMLGEFEAAVGELERALRIAREERDRPQEAETGQLLGVTLYFRGRHEEALAALARALSIRRDLGDEHRAGALESNIGLVHIDRGDLEAAEERFRVSLKGFRKIGFLRGEAVNLSNLGLVHSEMGRYERAMDFIEESLKIRRALGDRWGEGADLGNLGTVHARLGRFERAVPLLEEAVAIARESGNRGSEGTNACRLGIVEMHRGEADRAEERFRAALETASALRLPSLALLASAHIARAALLRGRPQDALAAIEEPLARSVEARMASWTIECLAIKAEALLAAGRIDDALSSSGEAVERLRAHPGWLERSHEVWFTRSRVLEKKAAEGGPAGEEAGVEATEALRIAHALLSEKADGIRDLELRESYLGNIPLHRRIAEARAARDEAVRRESLRRERSFYEISRSINSILDLEPLLDRLLDLAVETTRGEKGLILLLDPTGGFTVKAARDMGQESIADATEICRSVLADVSRRREAVLASDAAADERFRERKSVVDFHIRSLMCVPLTVRGELIGAVYVDSRSDTAFRQEDLLYLGSFAHLSAIAIENARLLARLRQENLYLRREIETRYAFDNLIGSSPAMQEVFALMEKVARAGASVLITGETGTGKELIARAIHFHGPRRDRSFVAVDCGALPETLLESELFGHKRGAFSGALYDRVGLFEEAAGGTIFLDEVTNTTADLQAKLLRVLQEGEVRRVGENVYRKVDVRVIAATNLRIEEAVTAGRFREDLYYRLNVVQIRVPPLRERREDVPLLAAHFLEEAGRRLGRKAEGFTEEAMKRLIRAPWKGNVRELEHVVEKALILAERDRIGVESLPDLPEPGEGSPEAAPPIDAAAGAAGGPAPGTFRFAGLTLEEFDARWLEAEAAYLRHLVREAGGNISGAARLAQVKNRNTLVARLKRHGIGR